MFSGSYRFSSRILTKAFILQGEEQGSDVMSHTAVLCPVEDKGKQIGSFFKERFGSHPSRPPSPQLPETGKRKNKKKPKAKNKKLTELLNITPAFAGTQMSMGTSVGNRL